MAPSKFQIYLDQSVVQATATTAAPPSTAMPAVTTHHQQQQQHQQQQYPPQAQQQQKLTTAASVTTTARCIVQQQQQQQSVRFSGQGGDQQAPKEPLIAEKSWPRYIRESLEGKNQRFYFDERKIYPVDGGEFSFEELNLRSWSKKQQELSLRRRCQEVEAENEDLRQKIDMANQQINALANALKQLQQQQLQLQQEQQQHLQLQLQQQQQQLQQQQQQPQVLQVATQHHHQQQELQQTHEHQSLPPTQTITGIGGSIKQQQSPPSNRLSIVPRSLQPAQGNDADTSSYGGLVEAPSVVECYWKHTIQMEKFTVPIDQSQYIRENCPTSTPNNKEDKAKRNGQRRMSRPSIGGSPTMKLSPITETSRDCNSKSSSSSSAMSTTPGTTKKPLVIKPLIIDEPERPLDPNDPSTYRKLLRALAEPLDRRAGFIKIPESMPQIKNGVCFGSGGESYLVDKELSKEAKIYSAQMLTDDSESSDTDVPVKTICFRVDQPPNDWLFYICNELHRRLVRQKTKPDIELSVMNADPAIVYVDGSILIDEYFRFVPLEDYFTACSHMHKPFPKAVAAYVSLELIQLIRGLHSCGIVHMNVNPNNIIITGCPTREDVSSADERTSIVKLIGFDHAMDTRLLPDDFRFKTKVDYMRASSVLDGTPWLHEIDWLGVLGCIHRMLFSEEMEPIQENDRWQVKKQFKGFPADVWTSLFDGLLNIDDTKMTDKLVERVVDELDAWLKANISYVLKEAAVLDMVLEEFCKAANKSVRI